MCDPRDLNHRRASAAAGLEPQGTGMDTLLGACPAGVERLQWGEAQSAPLFFLES